MKNLHKKLDSTGFDLSDFIRCNRSIIINEWVDRLHKEVSQKYSQRSRDELLSLVTEAFDTNTDILLHDDFKRINLFINKIARMRLKEGFLLSDLQKAFELYRKIAIPLLAKANKLKSFQYGVSKINFCLAYTIHRYSDHFQNIHAKEIMEYNRRLEIEVKKRTSENDPPAIEDFFNHGFFMEGLRVESSSAA